jgi:histone H1/5
MSSSSFTAVLQSQISTAVKKVLAEMDQSEQSDEFVAALFHELFPGTDVALQATLRAAPDSDSESTESKKGRKKGPMSDEAKSAMVAKRKATLAAKADAPADAPKPEPKAKLTKEEASKARSEAAKARYAALSEEEKAANKARLAAGKAAKKAVAAATAEA